MNRVRQPFNVNQLAMVAACAALDDDAFLAQSRAVNAAGLVQLARGLRAARSRVHPVVRQLRLRARGRCGARLRDPACAQGVIVRPIAGYGMPEHLRVTVGHARRRTSASSPRSSARSRREGLRPRAPPEDASRSSAWASSAARSRSRCDARAPCAKVVGVDRDAQALERAAALGVIDTAAESASEAAARRRSRLRVRAGARHRAGAARRRARPRARRGRHRRRQHQGATSCAPPREELRDRSRASCPGHPIAGREASGVEAAVAGSLPRRARRAHAGAARPRPMPSTLVRACWEACGAPRGHAWPPRPTTAIFAAVSHLPHVLAFALVSEIASRPDAAELLRLRRGRLPRFHAHRRELARDVARHRARRTARRCSRRWTATARALAVFRELVAKGDGPGLQRLMTEARNARRAWPGGTRSTSDEYAPWRSAATCRARHPRVGHRSACPARRASRTARCCSPRSPKATHARAALLDSDDTRVMLRGAAAARRAVSCSARAQGDWT